MPPPKRKIHRKILRKIFQNATYLWGNSFLGNAHFIIRRIMFLKNECMEKNTSAQWEFSGKIAFKDTLKAFHEFRNKQQECTK